MFCSSQHFFLAKPIFIFVPCLQLFMFVNSLLIIKSKSCNRPFSDNAEDFAIVSQSLNQCNLIRLKEV